MQDKKKVIIMGNTNQSIIDKIDELKAQGIDVISAEEPNFLKPYVDVLESMPPYELQMLSDDHTLYDLRGPEPKRFRNIEAQPARISKKDPKIGRNETCPCGSGKKYKSCCINK